MEPVFCEICGKGPLPQSDRCTNGRCIEHHLTYCTPGGATAPGHNRMWPAPDDNRK